MVLMYLYYNQPEAIKHLQRLGYDKCGIDIMFIDDGSKIPLKCDWATVYRIEEDIQWNMPRANNLGFSMIQDETVLRSDIDHYWSIDDLIELSKIKLKEKEIVKFERIYKGKRINQPKNVYLARVQDLIDIGGYNEIFCGNYGYEDGELMNRMRKAGFKFINSNIICKVDGNLCTKGLDRDTAINYKKYINIK